MVLHEDRDGAGSQRLTKNELLNYFIQQVTMSWPEEEMEKEATSNDVAHMMFILTVLIRAFHDGGR